MKQGQVRIIAGKWRGRRLKVPDIKGLRPTPDRVRETLFNWLAPMLPGAFCLDLFAGTGVLGFEALSRGARSVVMVDRSIEVIRLLQEELVLFDATKDALVYQAKVPSQLRQTAEPFDIVFLDPPYNDNLLIPTCHYLEENGFLARSAHIYLEAREAINSADLPANWHLLKSQKAGQVLYHLAKRD